MERTGEDVDVLDAVARLDDASMTLRTRTPVCGARTTVIDRLGSLRATGAIAEFEVQTWPGEVVLSDAAAPDGAIRTFERLEGWADERGASVRPAFDVRTVSSLVGNRREILTLPMMCLTVSSGDELVGVFPHQEGGNTVTIGDCLDAFERRADGDRETDAPTGVEPVSP
ncbi:hypothetical protein C2R22_08995 [Salinigranum rubrum]|uniref:Uncharacterized protein n=1 Tax=Salinigranum rubrum TaxID=755307 RepID=A0A2I8VIK9_9EURY|nr:HTH domain-containing protein [Salinigranum rubrum]AUV81767.1 hypothetical protein C2R22_08995 [Salinigranum rubrum]